MGDKAISTARLILSVRDERSRYFDQGLFDEQSWELMLILFVAAADGQTISRQHLIDRDIASPAAIDRWVDVLRAKGIVVATDWPGGELTLTADAQRDMDRLLETRATVRE